MKTIATVIATEGRIATVETERTSACEGCHKNEDGKGCSVCSLMGGERKFSARAYNEIGAKIGDRVMIESRTDRVIWYAVLVFVLPLLVALLGHGGASVFVVSDAWRVVCALIGFVGSFIVLWLYSGHVQKRRCDIVITEISEQ